MVYARNCGTMFGLYSVTSSLRHTVRGGVEAFQLDLLQKTNESTMLSNMEDRWVWDLNGDGVFQVFLDRLPTRSNLQHRGVQVSDSLCSICSSAQEDSSHLFFSCSLVTDVVRLVCRWWNLSWSPLGSYSDWLIWFNSIRLNSKVKGSLEGVFLCFLVECMDVSESAALLDANPS
ncbi:hypothetical protein CTI12_AA035750 [Artemisia annua]|uniref:Reverse transcriptase zinc-binding domain-containing protein n=1 Tax=Artemisia annua TaxID=35608 RepID=A0A2U1PNU8_ARTAN|nr:hypothetical protein CTI12_AA035750 [Artemisia annua]